MAIQGRVYGGQAPLEGAQIYLLEASISAYGGPGIAASASNASTSLIQSTATGATLDTSSGATHGFYYVTSDVNGNWSISGGYSCTQGEQVYLYTLGGGNGTTSYSNLSAGMLAALGTCPAGGNFLSGPSPIPYVVINEVSTIATAYAFAGFATDALHVGTSGSLLGQAGLANAFANATNLETISTGVALAVTPGSSSSAVPQLEINTLANILAACVNSTTPYTLCSTLFSDAESGGTTGTMPTDTATAAINMAHNPAANVTPLYGLSIGTPPFAPALTGQPNDFTIALNFSGGGISTPTAIAIDGTGDAWIADEVNPGQVTELSPLGVPKNGSPLTGGGLKTPDAVAIDLNGNAWIANYYNAGSITELSGSTGAVMGSSPFTGGGVNEPNGIAIDPSDNVWTSNFGESIMGNVSKLSNSGSADSGSNGYGTGMEINTAIAIDPGGNAWSTDLNFGSLDEVSNTGTLKSGVSGYGNFNNPTALAFDSASHVWVATHGNNVKVLTDTGGAVGTYTGGGLRLSQAIAIDGAGNAWIENTNASLTTPGLLSEFSNGGTAITPSTGYTSSTLISNTTPVGMAIDGSGDVWVANSGNSTVTEFIGAAVPVTTPLSYGVANSLLGTRP